MGTRRRVITATAIAAVVAAPLAALAGVGIAGAVERDEVGHRSEMSLSRTMAAPLMVSLTLSVEAISTDNLSNAVAVREQDVDEALAQTDEAIARLDAVRNVSDDLLDLSAAAASLRADLDDLRGRAGTDAGADADAAGGVDPAVAIEIRTGYATLATEFEDAVARELETVDDPAARTAATLAWLASGRSRATGDLQFLVLRAVATSPWDGTGVPELPPIPELPPMPGYPPMPEVPPMPEYPEYSPELELPPEYEAPPMPELPPMPTLPPDFTVPSVPPELLEPPSTLPPELTEPPPAVPTGLAVPSAARHDPLALPALLQTVPDQEPLAAAPEQSASLAQIAALAARVRALDADLSDAATPYSQVIADGLDDTDALLAAADALVAGQQVPITAIRDLPGSDDVSVARDILDRYDGADHPDPRPARTPDRQRAMWAGIGAGVAVFLLIVVTTAALVAVTAPPAGPVGGPPPGPPTPGSLPPPPPWRGGPWAPSA